MKRKSSVRNVDGGLVPVGEAKVLLTGMRRTIRATRQSIATSANATLTMLSLQLGQRIRQDILQEKRAEYGERIVSALGTQLAELKETR